MNNIDQKQQRREEWLKWDWEKSDARLARENNLTRERTRQIRRELNLPSSRLRLSTLTGRMSVDPEYYQKLFTEKTAFELSKILDISVSSVYHYARLLEVKTKQSEYNREPKHPWHLINFKLPTTILSEIWGINKAVLFQYRIRKRIKTGFKVSRNYSLEDPRWKHLVDAEIKQANQWALSRTN